MPNGQVAKLALSVQLEIACLAALCHDLTIGLSLKSEEAPRLIGYQQIKSYDLLVTCHPTLIFPNLTIEDKYVQTNHYSQLQNRLNGACMVRNLRHFRRIVSDDKFAQRFFGSHVFVFSGTITRDIAEITGHFSRTLDGKVIYLSFVMRQWALEDANAWPDLISTFRNAAELGSINESWVRKDLDKTTTQYLPKDPKKRPHDETPAPRAKRPRVGRQSESRSSPPRRRVCNEEAAWTCGSDDSGTCE